MDAIKDHLLTAKKRLGGSGNSKNDDIDEGTLNKEEYLATLILIANKKAQGIMRSADSMRNLVESFIDPNWTVALVEDRVRALMESQDVLNALQGKVPHLRELFDRKCSGSRDRSEAARTATSINSAVSPTLFLIHDPNFACRRLCPE